MRTYNVPSQGFILGVPGDWPAGSIVEVDEETQQARLIPASEPTPPMTPAAAATQPAHPGPSTGPQTQGEADRG